MNRIYLSIDCSGSSVRELSTSARDEYETGDLSPRASGGSARGSGGRGSASLVSVETGVLALPLPPLPLRLRSPLSYSSLTLILNSHRHSLSHSITLVRGTHPLRAMVARREITPHHRPAPPAGRVRRTRPPHGRRGA